MLVTPMAAVALFAAVALVVAAAKRLTDRFSRLPAPVWAGHRGRCCVVATVLTGRHYLYRHLVLFGDKYDSVIDRPA